MYLAENIFAMKALHKEYKWVGIAMAAVLVLLLVVNAAPGLLRNSDFWKVSAALMSMGLLYLVSMLFLNSRKVIEDHQ